MSWSSNNWNPKWVTAEYEPRLLASVVVPTYQNQAKLEAVLAGIARQRYPSDLIEVIVADDGSEPPTEPRIPAGLSVTVAWQEDRGFHLAAARNLGALKASGDVLIFLDDDMIPEVEWLSEHMRPHHHCPWVLGCGFRRHVADRSVDPEAISQTDSIGQLFQGEEFKEPGFILDWWVNHDEGRSQSEGIWRITSGGNLSLSAAAFWSISGFDQAYFDQWGGEDNDFGYRAYQKGLMIVPVRKALCWHIGWGTSDSIEVRELTRRTRELLAARIPDVALPDRSVIQPVVPMLWVRVTADELEIDDFTALANSAISCAVSTGISFEFRQTGSDFTTIQRMFEADSRIHVGDASSMPSSPAGWEYARVTLETTDPTWTSEQLDDLSSRISESGLWRLEIIHPSGSKSVAELRRVTEQLGVGLLDPAQARRQYDQATVTQASLAS